MLDQRRGADRADDNGYVETDPSRRYGRFNELLGKGATKTVYRAFDELNGTEVAWNQAKLSDVLRSPEALQRMYSEVHILSTLDHVSIIRFHASWIDTKNRTFNFITELFTSGSLREYRQKYRRVDIRAVKNWASQILHGLVYLHGHDPPVIHRDLKCDNIFVNGHLGQVKIGDLGLAAVLRESQNAHSVIGTPEFMAPELYEEDYNELVDIYSFGMCMLEMLTGEYPYSECTNPAQIYKKVTAGKLPDGFNRISDPEAKRFIGRCLTTAPKRSTAMELLSDPFLHTDEGRKPLPITSGSTAALKPKVTGDVGIHNRSVSTKPKDMTITGKLNPEDDTIFLKVKIEEKDGHVRNIYFPFDTVTDTPIDVANEMVKELEITDRDPSKIAEVIEKEISLLVPDWKERGSADDEDHQEYNYDDDNGHPFNSMASPTSSHMSEFGAGSTQGEDYWSAEAYQACWLGDDVFSNNDDASSVHSGKYSTTNYQAADDLNNLRSLHQSTGVGGALVDEFRGQCSMLPPDSPPQGSTCRKGKKKMLRNQSMVDVRSQLVNKTLLEGLKRRLFKTVGAVENIGFQMPYDESLGKSPSLSPIRGEGKKLGFMKGRG